MASIPELKKHIKSIAHIRQMTRATQLISAVKSRKAKAQLDLAFPFFAACAETMAILLTQTDEFVGDLMRLREKKAGEAWKIGVCIFSGDQGMAGAYSLNVLARAEQCIAAWRDERAADGFVPEFELRLVGEVGWERLREFEDVHIITGEVFPVFPPTYNRAGILSSRMQERYNTGEVDEVFFIYTRLNRAMSLEITTTRVLPADYQALQDIYQDYSAQSAQPLAEKVHIDYEPDPRKVFDYLGDTYLNGMVYGALCEAYASEQTARMLAMQSAGDNADELLDSLRLRSNRARQSKITSEISEIVGGAEVLRE